MAFKIAALSRIDAYPRAESHLTQRTISGAAISIMGISLMVLLFVNELQFYMTPYTENEMTVDVKGREKLPIHINITFPSLPCSVLSLDALDMSGKHEVDISNNIWKARLDSQGRPGIWQQVDKLDHADDTAHNEAHAEDTTEHDFALANARRAAQADANKQVEDIKAALANQEGCRVYGHLDVERVAGNFHISVHGQSYYVLGQVFASASTVNVSHHIESVSFGPPIPGTTNPLDGYTRILKTEQESGTFKYFIKVVPTEYFPLKGDHVETNQYSVTEYFMPSSMQPGGLPAVYFLYDLSPIAVKVTERRRNFGHFLTRICAVLGGTFAVTGMIDKWTYKTVQLFTSQRSSGSQ
ncbi:hypothetical protein KFL_002630210 [Klebsormidium nitens]|uniref:Uncharacterized protein n=1 Tax=Klebsormidium nitens TaxID=105231 RepID=A0A1Y1ID17_KLENI|nr:hypothetical protein KFL_002630210 [Klebsormidium nitens]|eukprot:GAQ85978.1 hypothetical protein KFL_002630210 [Klebsormidium nitens]